LATKIPKSKQTKWKNESKGSREKNVKKSVLKKEKCCFFQAAFKCQRVIKFERLLRIFKFAPLLHK